MSLSREAEDSEPLPAVPAGRLLVPVRSGPAGCAARVFRTPLGDRTAVCFTSERRLARTLGREQSWITLAEPAIRALMAPLGVTRLTVDPQFAAPAASARGRRTVPPASARRDRRAGTARLSLLAG